MSQFETQALRAHEAMRAEIDKYALETLRHYPSDFEKDRQELLVAAEPGARFAWKVGHCGTHLIQLGLHAKRNEYVTYITRDSASDRFYTLDFNQESFRLQEVSREAFAQLVLTRVPYEQQGSDHDFWLVRAGVRVGHCHNEFTGTSQNLRYRSTLTLTPGLKKTDQRALQSHAIYSCLNLAHTLFFHHDVVIAQPADCVTA